MRRFPWLLVGQLMLAACEPALLGASNQAADAGAMSRPQEPLSPLPPTAAGAGAKAPSPAGATANPPKPARDAGSTVDEADSGAIDAGPPACRGQHAPCSFYGAHDEPSFCTRHGCTWQAGACNGTPHRCSELSREECNYAFGNHSGCN